MKLNCLNVLPVLSMVLLLTACGGFSTQPAPVYDRSVDRQQSVTSSLGKQVASPTPTPETVGYYMVNKGDTLYAIAFRFNLNYQDIADWNGIGEPYTIYPGQQLSISQQTATYTKPDNATANHTTASHPIENSTTTNNTVASNATTLTVRPSTTEQPRPITPPPVAADQNRKPVEQPTEPTVPAISQPVVATNAVPSASIAKPPLSSVRVSRGVEWLWPVAGGTVNRTFLANENNRQGLDISGTPGQPVLAAADGTVVYSGPGLTGYAELIIIKHNGELLSAYGHNRRRLVQEGESVKSGQQIAELGRSPRGEDEMHFQIRRLGKPQNPQDYLPNR